MNEQTLGKRIVAHRKRMGLTQDALAERLGVTAQAVSKWENDQSCPDISMIPRLAELFGISTDELLGVAKKQVHEAQIVEDEETEGIHVNKGEWNLKLDSGRKGKLGLAIWVLLAGCLLLLNSFSDMDVGLWDVLWPTALLTFGVFGLWPRFSFLRLGCALVGGYYTLANIGITPFPIDRSLILPVWFLALGLSLLVEALNKKKTFAFRINGNGKNATKCIYDTEGERFRSTVSFGEGKHHVLLPKLSGGNAEVSFGELTVDLQECEEIADGCVLDTKCSFGEMTVEIPVGCIAEQNISCSFGSVEYEGSPAAGAATTIHINGSVSFGSIVIRYLS